MTFDILGCNDLQRADYRWKHEFEVFAVCRHCEGGTIFWLILEQYHFQEEVKRQEFWASNAVLNGIFDVPRFISVRDKASHNPPEHVPEEIAAAFTEGATCLSVECFNAATTMFRLCLDLASKPLLPDADDDSVPQPTKHQRRTLKPRLEWLIGQNLLSRDLEPLLENLREDGNDGAHDGTLGKDDAEDAMDFATVLLQGLYTNPERLRLANERRAARRAKEA